MFAILRACFDISRGVRILGGAATSSLANSTPAHISCISLKEISFGKLLLNLFRTARKYNVVIQPQLILLQKTLFNVEGMGRRLYPDLDLWKTAKPNLEKWVSKEVGFRKIFSEFKKELPDIVKDFPKLPRLFKNFLQNSREFDSRKFFISEKNNKLNNKINFICFLNLILTLGLLLIFYFVIT